MRTTIIIALILLNLESASQVLTFDTVYVNNGLNEYEFMAGSVDYNNHYLCYGLGYDVDQPVFRFKEIEIEANQLINHDIILTPEIDIAPATGQTFLRTEDGGFIYSGDIGLTIQPFQGLVFKFSSDFQIEWTQPADQFLSDTTFARWDVTALLEDNNYVMAGEFAWHHTHQWDYGEKFGIAVTKMATDGSSVWDTVIDFDVPLKEVTGIIELPSGEILISATEWIDELYNTFNCKLYKLSASGDSLDEFTWSGGNYNYCPRMVLNGDLLSLLYTHNEEPAWSLGQFYAELRLSTFSLSNWLELDNIVVPVIAMDVLSHYTQVKEVLKLEDDNLVFVCEIPYYNEMGEPNTTILTKTTPSGAILWQTEIPVPDLDTLLFNYIHDLDLCADGGFLLCGVTESVGEGQKHWLVKSDPCGDIEYAGCPLSVRESEIPKSTLQLFPNPANDQIQISFDNNHAAQWISIFDMQGQVVLSEMVKSYQDKKALDISNLESGIYLVHAVDEQGNVAQQRFVKE